MKPTITYEITLYMQRHKEDWGGNIEDYIRVTNGAKGDTTARRLREMVEDGLLFCEKRNPPGKSNKVNYYWIANTENNG